MKSLLLAIALLNLTGCASFMHGVKCSYVNCSGTDSTPIYERSQPQSWNEMPEAQAIQSVERRNPKMAKQMRDAIPDDELVLVERHDSKGNVYYQAR